tara:strand:+ start:6857 stop:7885 length:1029 start_codon:yes stop_codon:yes gene_type:complete
MNNKIFRRPMFNKVKASSYGRGITSNLVTDEERVKFNYGGRVGYSSGSPFSFLTNPSIYYGERAMDIRQNDLENRNIETLNELNNTDIETPNIRNLSPIQQKKKDRLDLETAIEKDNKFGRGDAPLYDMTKPNKSLKRRVKEQVMDQGKGFLEGEQPMEPVDPDPKKQTASDQNQASALFAAAKFLASSATDKLGGKDWNAKAGKAFGELEKIGAEERKYDAYFSKKGAQDRKTYEYKTEKAKEGANLLEIAQQKSPGANMNSATGLNTLRVKYQKAPTKKIKVDGKNTTVIDDAKLAELPAGDKGRLFVFNEKIIFKDTDGSIKDFNINEVASKLDFFRNL